MSLEVAVSPSLEADLVLIWDLERLSDTAALLDSLVLLLEESRGSLTD